MLDHKESRQSGSRRYGEQSGPSVEQCLIGGLRQSQDLTGVYVMIKTFFGTIFFEDSSLADTFLADSFLVESLRIDISIFSLIWHWVCIPTRKIDLSILGSIHRTVESMS